MSLLDAYADSAGQEYDRQLRHPAPQVAPSFSLFTALGAGFKGPVAATLEQAGSLSDLLHASVSDLSGAGSLVEDIGSLINRGASPAPAGFLPSPLRTPEQSNPLAMGDVLRRRADEFAPDPVTSHTADKVVFGLTRFATKAVENVGTMGPAGALPLALEEGNTATQRGRMNGLDPETALKIGALEGAVAGATAVVPLGGRTIMQTLGLTAAAGPGAYVAQEALTRDILQRAGYQDEASLHNPADPLGLTLATLIPGVIGGAHIRGLAVRGAAVKGGTLPLEQLRPDELRALKFNDPRLDAYASDAAERAGVPAAVLLGVKNAGEKSDPTAVSPAGAQGVMQFMPGTAKEMGLGDRTDPLASIDAGAAYLRKLYNAYGSWDAAVAHYNGGGAQAAIVRGGGRPTAPETAAYLERVQKYAADHFAEQGAARPDVVDAARVRATAGALQDHLPPDVPDAQARVLEASDLVASGDREALERTALGNAYDQVWTSPQGDKFDPLVRIQPDDIEASAIARGGWKGIGDAEVKGQGFGLVKFIWRHGEESGKPAEHQVTRGDVMAFPGVIRQYEATLVPARGDQPPYREWRVQLPDAGGQARQVVYVDKEMGEAGRHVVSMYVQEPGRPGADVALSKQRPGVSPEPVAERADAAATGTPPSVLRPSGQDQPGVPSVRPFTASRPTGANELATLERTLAESAGARPAGSSKAGTTAKRAAGDEPAPSKADGASPSIDESVAQQIAAERPDLRVVLPGEEAPLTVAEAMARIREQQADEAGFGDLLRVAAECALRT
jgi:hypothetical protein